MQKQNKFVTIIKSKSGASMMFVLAIMLLLMAITVSVLVAASTGAASGINEHANNQLFMYAESMQKTIMYSLQTSDSDIGRNAASAVGAPPLTFGGQLLSTAYKQFLESSENVEINVSPELISNELDLSSVEISLKFTPSVIITPPVAAQPEIKDPDGNVISPSIERQPQTAEIKGTAKVTVTAEYRGKSIITVATYSLTNGFLKDNGDDKNMLIENAGEWRLISHEKADK